MKSLVLLATLVSLGACGASDTRHVTTARQISARTGPPDVQRIVDLGDLSAIPATGAISTAASDKRFLVGELILIEGEDFGKLPTVAIGGKPAKNLARTKNGGIVSRIPPEVSAGPLRIEVSHPDGSDSKDIEVERYLALASQAAVHLLSAHADGKLTRAHAIPTSAADSLAFSFDGQALYIASKGAIQTVALAAAGSPRTTARLSLGPKRLRALVWRRAVPLLAALGDSGVTFIDNGIATAVSEGEQVSLQDGALAGAFSPNGQHLAVLGRTDNTVYLIDTQRAQVVSKLALMPNEAVPLARDLAFAPAGDELWVVSGNSKESIVAGLRPTQITRLRLADAGLELVASATIAQAAGPLQMAVSQREAVMAAAAVRSTRQRAALVLSSVSASHFGTQPAASTKVGRLFRFDLEGNASALAEGPAVHSGLCLSHDQRWVYSASRAGKEILASVVALDGGKPFTLTLGEDNLAPLTLIPLAIAP